VHGLLLLGSHIPAETWILDILSTFESGEVEWGIGVVLLDRLVAGLDCGDALEIIGVASQAV